MKTIRCYHVSVGSQLKFSTLNPDEAEDVKIDIQAETGREPTLETEDRQPINHCK